MRWLALAVLLGGMAAFADMSGPRPTTWNVRSKSGRFTLTYDRWKPTPDPELAKDKAALEELQKRAAALRKKGNTLPPLTREERHEVGLLTEKLRDRKGPRLTLTDGEKVVWSVDARGIFGEQAAVSDDGKRAVVAEPSPSTSRSYEDADSKQLVVYPVLTLLGEEGAVVRRCMIEDIVPEAYRDGLTRSVSHITWLEGLSIDDARGELTVVITSRGQAPPIAQVPKSRERKLSLSSGDWLD